MESNELFHGKLIKELVRLRGFFPYVHSCVLSVSLCLSSKIKVIIVTMFALYLAQWLRWKTGNRRVATADRVTVLCP